ncbi:hypothetical protein L195_g027923, partial [Trifolium pratense]
LQANLGREGQIGTSWISSTAATAADAVLSTCPSPYEKRCLLQLLAATDFGDGGNAAAYYRRLYWKINLAEPLLRKDDELHLGNENWDDASLLSALEKNRHWEQARNWAKQLEASGAPWKSAMHHVTESQALSCAASFLSYTNSAELVTVVTNKESFHKATVYLELHATAILLYCLITTSICGLVTLHRIAESMVAEWKEFLWDVPEERVALWSHCHALFIRYSFPSLQAGLFFLKHAEAVEKDLPARELHELLLLSLQWLSGMISLSNPVCPLQLLREIETKVWLLAVESETQVVKETSILPFLSERMLSRTTPVLLTELQVGGKGWSGRTGKGCSFFIGIWANHCAKQLQYKFSPGQIPSEFRLVDAALKLASMSTPSSNVPVSMIDEEVHSVLQTYGLLNDKHRVDPLQVLESLVVIFTEGSGRGLYSSDASS